jgi:uncharacterized protein with GYD domain
MPLFITQGRYTNESIKGLVAHPEDRHEIVAKLAKKAGCKLLSFYITLGEYDFLTVTEAPSAQEASAFILAAAAGGGVTDVKTIVAMTTAEAKEAFAMASKAAGSYIPPGKA